jgi:predicted nucleic acid-binding protein
MEKTFKLQDYNLLSNRNIFFDANILIYLFWPTGEHYYEQNYARVFKNLLKQKNELYVDFLIISEVINRVLRIEHKKYNSTQNFKEFKNSEEGNEVQNDIFIIVKNEILKNFKVIGKSFQKEDIYNFLVLNELDFIDKATASLCKENNMVLLTNDKDFKNSGVDVLSGNPKILNP